MADGSTLNSQLENPSDRESGDLDENATINTSIQQPDDEDDDDMFGEFGEAEAIQQPADDEDDEFGEFGEAETAPPAQDLEQKITPSPALPSASIPPASGPDLLGMSDEDFLTAASDAWSSYLRPCASPSTPSDSQSQDAAVSRLRAMRMMPHGVDPDSVFGYGGLPLAQVSPHTFASWVSSCSTSESEGSRAASKLLGQAYKPAVRWATRDSGES